MRRDRRWHGARHATDRAPSDRAARQPVTVSEDQIDEELFYELYAQHRDVLFSHVLRLTDGDAESAEDIVTEAIHRAWQDRARRDRRPSAVRPWLIVLARAVHAERYGNSRTPDGDDLAAFAGPVASTTIVAAMNELSGLHRGVLIDLFYRGMSVEQTAATLGVPVDTVKSRLYYALRALRMVLQQQDRR
jgi:RNA polymerase sigma-70 factor (ECF subfamily)